MFMKVKQSYLPEGYDPRKVEWRTCRHCHMWRPLDEGIHYNDNFLCNECLLDVLQIKQGDLMLQDNRVVVKALLDMHYKYYEGEIVWLSFGMKLLRIYHKDIDSTELRRWSIKQTERNRIVSYRRHDRRV